MSDILQGNPKRLRIYEGLKSIGKQIGGFYLDGVRVAESQQFISKTNLIGHLVREIGFGLTDVLDTTKARVDAAKELKVILNEFRETKSEGTATEVLTRVECSIQELISKLANAQGAKQSILNALDASQEDGLAQEWLSVLDEVHAKAHRSGVWKDPKDPKIGEQLWCDFEILLEKLVGTYTRMCDRIDRLISCEKPSKKLVEGMSGLLSSDSLRDYFFDKLSSPHWLKHLNEAGYFSLRESLKPSEVSDQPGHYRLTYWYELGYLLRIAGNKEAGKPTLKEISKIITNIIAQNSGKQRIDNPSIDCRVAEIITKLPQEYLTDEMINYLNLTLESRWGSSFISSTFATAVLPYLLSIRRKEYICSILDKALSIQSKGNNDKTLMEEFWLNEFITKYSDELVQLCGKEIIEICILKIRDHISKDKYGFAFESLTKQDIDKLHPDNYRDILIIMLVKTICCNKLNLDALSFVNGILRDEHPFFRRLAVYTIGKHFITLRDIFWDLTKSNIDEFASGEIRELLSDHCLEFDGEQIKEIVNWVETSAFFVSEEYKEQEAEIQKFRRLRFYYAMEKTKNQTILEIIEQYSAETQSLVGVQKADSLPSRADLLQKSPKEIVESLNSYYTGNSISQGQDKTLEKLFAEIIEEQAVEFSYNLIELPEVNLAFKFKLVELYSKEKTFEIDIDWVKVLQYIESILKDDENFWGKMGPEVLDPCRLAISNIITTLEKIIEKKKLTASDNLLAIFENIISLITEKTCSSLKFGDNYRDAILGNTLARAYTVAVNYYFYAQDHNEISKSHKAWTRELLIERARTNNSPELYAVLAAYLRKIAQQDSEFVQEMCKHFPDSNQLYFEAAADNYLTYYRNPYKPVYLKLKDMGFYERAIELSFPTHTEEALVYHTVVGHFQNWEIGTYQLLDKIIESNKPERLISVLTCISVDFSESLSVDTQERVKAVWKSVYKQIKDKINEDVNIVTPYLIKPISGVSQLDDEIWEILNVAANKPTGRYHFYFTFFERHVEVEPDRVGQLFIKVLGSECYPPYEKEQIRNIVDKLFLLGQKEYAILICNTYARNGHHFLRDIENKHI